MRSSAPNRIPRPPPRKHAPDVLASSRKRLAEEVRLDEQGGYPLPEELARHAREGGFAPGELREVCRSAGEGLGGRTRRRPGSARRLRWWRCGGAGPASLGGALRAARRAPRYLRGYEIAVVSGELPEERVERAARARWGEGWEEKLEESSATEPPDDSCEASFEQGISR